MQFRKVSRKVATPGILMKIMIKLYLVTPAPIVWHGTAVTARKRQHSFSVYPELIHVCVCLTQLNFDTWLLAFTRKSYGAGRLCVWLESEIFRYFLVPTSLIVTLVLSRYLFNLLDRSIHKILSHKYHKYILCHHVFSVCVF